MNNKPIRHGEIMLVPNGCKAWENIPNREIPAGSNRSRDRFIVGHSETGHHHVLEAAPKQAFNVTETDKKQLFFRLFQPTSIVHKKATDKHNTLTVEPGVYKRYHDTEYDPFGKVIRNVAD